MAKRRKPRVAPTPGSVRLGADDQTRQLRKLVEDIPQGKVTILSSENARYTIFHSCLNSLILPQNSRFEYLTGCYVVDSCNNAVKRMLPEDDWIMFFGDDHVFPPWLTLRLLKTMYEQDLDIIAPLCFRRSFPPVPVVFEVFDSNIEKEYIRAIDLDKFPDGGLIEVDAVGSAGMIARRRVLDAMEPPHFRIGVQQEGEDIYFCRIARSLGFKIHVDLDVGLGHIVNTTLWPKRTHMGWGVEYDFGMQGGFFMPKSNLQEAMETIEFGYVEASHE